MFVQPRNANIAEKCLKITVVWASIVIMMITVIVGQLEPSQNH